MDERRDDLDSTKQQHADKRYELPDGRSAAPLEYRVDALRETLIGGAIKPDALAGLLNARARQGWTLKQLVDTDVKGRVGPGGIDGLLAIFERPTDA